MDLFKQYNNKITFNVKLIPADLQGTTRAISVSGVKDIIPKYYASSNKTRNVFFRAESHRFLMVDLDNNPSQKIIKEIKNRDCFLIIQTSSTRYQAYFYCKQIKSWEDYTTACKYLSNKWNADLASCKKGQVARLPGYINHKPGRNKFVTKIVFQPVIQSSSRSKKKSLPVLVFTRTERKEMTEMAAAPREPREPREPRQPNRNNGNGGGGGGSSNDGESNKLPEEMANDWAFLNHCYQNDNSMSHQDLFNVLATVSSYSDNQSYLNHTVENFLNNN